MEGAFIGGQGELEQPKAPPPPPPPKKAPPMSFAEQIAAQAANLKKRGEVNKDAPIKAPKQQEVEVDGVKKSFLGAKGGAP